MQSVCVFVLVCRMCVGGTEGQSSANVWKGALAWREAAECRDLYLSLRGRRHRGEEMAAGGDLGRRWIRECGWGGASWGEMD